MTNHRATLLTKIKVTVVTGPSRHDRFCLEIFLKRDKLKWSDTKTPFNGIFPDREKVEKS